VQLKFAHKSRTLRREDTYAVPMNKSVANNCQFDDAEHLAQGYRTHVDCTLLRLQDTHTLTSEPDRQTMLFRTLFFFTAKCREKKS